MIGLSPPSEEMELASRLLDVTNEGELRDHLGALVAEVARRSGGSLPARVGEPLVERLARTAVQTLPTLTTVLGTSTAPGAGSMTSPTATAARVYGLALEGISAEDRDFEIARQLVRLTQAAAAEAATSPAVAAGAAGVNAAFDAAAREFAPGLVPPGRPVSTGARSGAWTRRGNTLVLHGLEPSRSQSIA